MEEVEREVDRLIIPDSLCGGGGWQDAGEAEASVDDNFQSHPIPMDGAEQQQK